MRPATCGSRSTSRWPRASAAAPPTRPPCCGPCAASAPRTSSTRSPAGLGTDVPFFLSGAETGFCTGRGDRVQALPDFPRGHAFVVVPAAEGLSTADVYAASEPNPAFRADEGELIRRMHTVRRAADVAALMANDLEAAALRLRPEVAGALEQLRSAGALAAQVSGSGPTAFGLFEHRDAANEAAAGIKGALTASPV